MKICFYATVPLFTLVAAGLAQAQSRPANSRPPAVVSAEAPRGATTWYGWQTLTVDAASLLVTTIGFATRGQNELSPVLVATGLVGTVVGGPAVHWAHGRVGTGFMSLGVRVGAPVGAALSGAAAGAVVGFALTGGNALAAYAFGGLGGLGGLVLGSAAAVAVDASVFAREPSASESATRLRFVPTGSYDPQRKMAHVGIAGSF